MLMNVHNFILLCRYACFMVSNEVPFTSCWVSHYFPSAIESWINYGINTLPLVHASIPL